MSKQPYDGALLLKSPENYKRDLDYLTHATDVSALYLQKISGKPYDVCHAYVVKQTAKGGKFEMEEKKCEITYRKPNGDRDIKDVSIRRYLQKVESDNSMMSPNMIVYTNPDKLVSPISENQRLNKAMRSAIKDEELVHQRAGNQLETDKCNQRQNGVKIMSNGSSGMRLSAHNPLYDPTAHSSMTSTSRITTAYSNAILERVLGGNRHYYDQNTVMNDIVTIIHNCDLVRFGEVMAKWKINIPSVDTIMKVITRSSDMYFINVPAMGRIRDLLCKLTDVERCAYIYTGDLFTFYDNNKEMFAKFVFDVVKTDLPMKTYTKEQASAVLDRGDKDMIALANVVANVVLKGELASNYIESDPSVYNAYITITEHLIDTIWSHSELLITLLGSADIPSNVFSGPGMIRRVGVGGDTDSSIFTVQCWVKMLMGSLEFTDTSISVSALMTYFDSQVKANALASLSRQMGVKTSDLYSLTMKNEFFMPTYIKANMAKHYAALVTIREGNALKEPFVHLIGRSFKDSKKPDVIMHNLQAEIKYLLLYMKDNIKIDFVSFLKRVANLENMITESVGGGKTEFLSNLQIKEKDGYGDSPMSQTYAYHDMWMNVFAGHYKYIPDAPYSAFKLKTTILNKTAFLAYEASLPNELAEKMLKWRTKNKKMNMKVTSVPALLFSDVVPPMIMEMCDVRLMVRELMDGYYALMEALGYFHLSHADNIVETMLTDTVTPDASYGLPGSLLKAYESER